jgi:hypothetical protein
MVGIICSILGFICKSLMIRMVSMNCLLLLGTVIPKKIVKARMNPASQTYPPVTTFQNLSRLLDTSAFEACSGG